MVTSSYRSRFSHFYLSLSNNLKSQRLGSRVWKSSNLAMLQGLHIEVYSQVGGLSSITEMEKKAEEVHVRLDMEGKAEYGVDYRLCGD